MFLQEIKRMKEETYSQSSLKFDKIKTAKNCTEKKEIIHSQQSETLINIRSN